MNINLLLYLDCFSDGLIQGDNDTYELNPILNYEKMEILKCHKKFKDTIDEHSSLIDKANELLNNIIDQRISIEREILKESVILDKSVNEVALKAKYVSICILTN